MKKYYLNKNVLYAPQVNRTAINFKVVNIYIKSPTILCGEVIKYCYLSAPG